MTQQRLGARADFADWANSVVATVKKHRSLGSSQGSAPGRSRLGLRRWATRLLTKIAD